MNSSELSNLLCDLVAIPSVNPMGGIKQYPHSRAMVEYLEKWFQQRGIARSRQTVAGDEQNLIAILPGPPGAPILIFDAHTDTVPAEGWEDRAFSPRREGNRIYGRGSCDTKASLAAMMTAMAAVAKQKLPHTVILLASADEEYGRTGVRTYLETKPPLHFAVVGEPTLCQPVTACKGAARWEIVVKGRSAHSSTPRKGVNAIVRMAAVIQLLDEYARTVLPKKTHSMVDAATLTASVIRGGTAINVVPDMCRLSVDLRTRPNENPADAMAEVQSFLAQRLDFPVESDSIQLWEGADVALDHPLTRHCVNACRIVLGETVPITPLGVNYGCHASDYTVRGIPAIVLGPGDIALAHTVDESVEVDSVRSAAAIYQKIMINPIPMSL